MYVCIYYTYIHIHTYIYIQYNIYCVYVIIYNIDYIIYIISYTMKYHSATKTEWNVAICNNVHGLGGDYAKWN